MTEFMDFIRRLFGENGYMEIPQPNPDMPFVFKSNECDDYWLLAESLYHYRKQADLFEWFKGDIVNRFPLAEKNTSLLLLVDTEKQQGNYDEVEIENDPLFFKKYVLPYTEDSLHALKDKIQNSERGTLLSLIMKNETFEAVKNGEGYAILLYTIVHKLPFIPIEVENQQVEQQTFAFKTPEIAELYDSLNNLPPNIDNEDANRFINNYLNADNYEEH